MQDLVIHREEEECFVASVVDLGNDDRPADGAAKVIEVKIAVFDQIAAGIDGSERIAGVGGAVPHELVQVAVEGITCRI